MGSVNTDSRWERFKVLLTPDSTLRHKLLSSVGPKPIAALSRGGCANLPYLVVFRQSVQ